MVSWSEDKTLRVWNVLSKGLHTDMFGELCEFRQYCAAPISTTSIGTRSIRDGDVPLAACVGKEILLLDYSHASSECEVRRLPIPARCPCCPCA
jgi:hypothetical protein